MEKNMGQFDRVARTVLAAAIIFGYTSGWIESKTLQIIALIFAAIFLLTAIIGVCPIYRLFDMDTRSLKSKGQDQHHVL